MKKILVTGSFGFIASHVVEELRTRGYTIIGLTRHLADRPIGYFDKMYLGDIRDQEVVEKAVNASDGVINLAGILGTQETVSSPYNSVAVNINGALNILEAARIWKVPVIQISVGNYFEKNPYSLTKSCAEGFAQMYAKYNGVKVNVVRALNAFGERQKAYPIRKIIPSFITRALENEAIQVYGDGQQMMDMIYVKDVANILINSLEQVSDNSVPTGQVFEAGTGIGRSVQDIAQQVIHLSGSNSLIENLPMRPGETTHAQVIAQHPVEYAYTPFDIALHQTIRWYKENKDLWKK